MSAEDERSRRIALAHVEVLRARIKLKRLALVELGQVRARYALLRDEPGIGEVLLAIDQLLAPRH